MAEKWISKLRQEHLNELHAIDLASFKDPWSREAFEKELTNPLAYYLVLQTADEVLGYVGSWLVLDECQITNIAILPKARKQGCGKILLDRLIKDAKKLGMNLIYLEVRASNRPAQRLYRHFGFKEIGQRDDFYGDGETALLMKLDLS